MPPALVSRVSQRALGMVAGLAVCACSSGRSDLPPSAPLASLAAPEGGGPIEAMPGRDDTLMDLIRWAPADAEALLLVSYARLRGRPWARGLLARAGTAEPQEARGYPLEAVDRVLSVARPVDTGGTGAPGLEVVVGHFDPEAVAEAFRAHHGHTSEESFRGRRLLRAPDDAAVAFGGERVLLFGPRAAVRSAIDAAEDVGGFVGQETWFADARTALARRWRGGPPVSVDLYLHVTPTVRARLVEALGEGETLRWAALRIGGGAEAPAGAEGLDAALVGMTNSEAQAEDFVTRLRARLLDVRGRPIGQALGLEQVVNRTRVGTRGAEIGALTHLPPAAWAEVSDRLSALGDVLRRNDPTQAPRPPAR